MSRSVAEWIAAHDDAAIPPRVKARILDRQENRCAGDCGRMFSARIRPEFDHIVALANGGEHREANLRALCLEEHRVKTAADMAVKKKIARVKRKHLGLENKRSRFATARTGKWKAKIGGCAERRDE